MIGWIQNNIPAEVEAESISSSANEDCVEPVQPSVELSDDDDTAIEIFQVRFKVRGVERAQLNL